MKTSKLELLQAKERLLDIARDYYQLYEEDKDSKIGQSFLRSANNFLACARNPEKVAEYARARRADRLRQSETKGDGNL